MELCYAVEFLLSKKHAFTENKERGEKRKRRDSPGDSRSSKKMAPIMERFLLRGTKKTGVGGGDA